MPGNELTQNQELRQELSLSHRQLQALELLQTPVWELQEKLQEMIAANPVLEVETIPGEETVPPEEFVGDEEPRGYDEDGEALYGEAAEWASESPVLTRDDRDLEFTPRYDQEKRDYLLNSLTTAPTLHQQLSGELALQELSPRQRELAGLVIDSLGDDGYLHTAPADLAMAAGAEMSEIEAAVELVQSFDPPGVGARSLAECLALQLRRRGETDPRLYELVEHYLEEVAQNRLPRLARELGVSLTELDAMLRRIRSLNPAPGGALAPVTASYIQPELEITAAPDGSFVVEEDERAIPRPHLSERYLELFERNDLSAEERSYLREKLNAARELLRALEQRRTTLRRIAGVIARTQGDFFRRGVEGLHPLTMRQVADEVGVHETTVSRAIAGKYLRTPQGVLEFRFFFSPGYETEGGESVSNRAVMERIRALIAEEDPRRPLSDEKLSQLLKEEGLKVARRTVAKYREAMAIPATPLRRSFTD